MRKTFAMPPSGTAILLAYTSGYVDTFTFVALFGLFSAHVTGNFVLIAASLVEFRLGLWIKLLAIPVFVLSAIGTRMFIIRRERKSREAAAHVLIAQAVLLFVFMIVATRNEPFEHNDTTAIATGLLAVAAMAVQNTAARTFFSDMPPTTVMTGNLIQVIVDTVDILHGHKGVEAKRARLARLGPMLLAFVIGTVTAAIAYVWVGFWGVAVPIVAVSAASFTVGPFVKAASRA